MRLVCLLTVLSLGGCGDTGAPVAPDRVPGPVEDPELSAPEETQGADNPPPTPGDREPPPGPVGWQTVDLYGDSALKVSLGECWDGHDCEADAACMHSEPFRARTGAPGVCMLHPSADFVGLLAVSPVRFTDEGSSPDPTTDEFVVEPGTFDVTFMADQDGWTTALDLPGFPLPIEPGVGFGFYWQVGIYIRVVHPNDPAYDIECNVAFLRSGEVVGAVLREPGKVLCSTNNWQSPQDPGAPGLLIEYEQCAPSETAWNGSEYCPPN